MTAPDPMKGFRGVMAGTLIIEAIVVALALLVVHRTGGLASWKGLLVGGIVLGLVLTCGLLRFKWAMYVVIALQLVMLGSFFAVTELGVLGVIFGLVWTYLFWLRRDVARRMAEGRLPSQQER